MWKWFYSWVNKQWYNTLIMIVTITVLPTSSCDHESSSSSDAVSPSSTHFAMNTPSMQLSSVSVLISDSVSTGIPLNYEYYSTQKLFTLS